MKASFLKISQPSQTKLLKSFYWLFDFHNYSYKIFREIVILKVWLKFVETTLKKEAILDVVQGLNSFLHCSIMKKILVKILLFLKLKSSVGAEEFIKIFTGCHLKQLASLNLACHILLTPARNCKNYALGILKIYLDANPSINQFQIETIVNYK